MAKRRFTFSSLLPPYAPPRNEWRRRVHAAVLEAQAARGVGYSEGDRLEVRLELYLGGRPLAMMDIDDRVNDVIDALGGHIAGPRSRRKIAPIVPSADQIRRIVLEKSPRVPRGRPVGQITLARYRRRRRA
jgi:hypothetical protein